MSSSPAPKNKPPPLPPLKITIFDPSLNGVSSPSVALQLIDSPMNANSISADTFDDDEYLRQQQQINPPLLLHRVHSSSTTPNLRSRSGPKLLRLASSRKVLTRQRTVSEASSSIIGVLNVEIEDVNELQRELNSCKCCFSCSHMMFSAASFPFGSFFALITACVGIGLQLDGWIVADAVIYKYNKKVWNFIWLWGIISAVVLVVVNVSIFLHGVSLFFLGYTKGEMLVCGCCSTQLHYRSGFCDRAAHKCGSCVGTVAQITVAVVGTIGIWIVYFLALGVTFICTGVVGISWLLEKSCITFQQGVQKYISLAKDYLGRARIILSLGEDKAYDLLKEFQNIRDLTSMFSDSALGEIVGGFASTGASTMLTQKISAAGTGSGASTASAEAMAAAAQSAPRHMGRLLFSSSIDPEAMLAQGISTMDILNQTIMDVEKQILYYEGVAAIMTEFCFDAASLYEAVIILSIGAFVVSVSQMLMFAFHVRQFTAWNYEVDLIRMLKDDDVEMMDPEMKEWKNHLEKVEFHQKRKAKLEKQERHANIEEERKEKARSDWANQQRRTESGRAVEMMVRRADTFVHKKKKKKMKKTTMEAQVDER